MVEVAGDVRHKLRVCLSPNRQFPRRRAFAAIPTRGEAHMHSRLTQHYCILLHALVSKRPLSRLRVPGFTFTASIRQRN
jgi:hypothetical protein